MRMNFKKFAIGLMLLSVACADYEVDIPDYESKGNIVAYFEPWSKEVLNSNVQIFAAITGVEPVSIRQNEIQSELFNATNGLLDVFQLRSGYAVDWNKCYTLKSTIQNKYRVSGSICTGDSLTIQVLDSVAIEEVFELGESPGYDRKMTLRIQGSGVEGNAIYYYYGNAKVNFSGNSVLYPNESRLAILPSGAIDTITVFLRKNETTAPEITQLSEAFFKAAQAEEISENTGFNNSGPVSYTNVVGGAGLISLRKVYSIKR